MQIDHVRKTRKRLTKIWPYKQFSFVILSVYLNDFNLQRQFTFYLIWVQRFSSYNFANQIIWKSSCNYYSFLLPSNVLRNGFSSLIDLLSKSLNLKNYLNDSINKFNGAIKRSSVLVIDTDIHRSQIDLWTR